ncbi:MAG: DM13 domain-containing protein, partial [Pseudomonadota bacterium]
NTGRSQYEIPSSIDVSAYNEVWIWCERFNVPLGVAKLA